MLGSVHRCQPTMILHSKKSGSFVTSVISCRFIVFGFNKIRNIRNLMRIYCFGINLIFVIVFISA